MKLLNTNVIVKLNFGTKDIDVGELKYEGNKIYFKYYSSFLDSGLQISPITLPLSNKIYSEDKFIFEGLFGVFNDSISDGFGRLLIDKSLMNYGYNRNEITPLHRLLWIGESGPGALTYHPSYEGKKSLDIDFDLDSVHKKMKYIESNLGIIDIENLAKLNGSSGGARPKINVWYNEQKGFGLNKRFDEGYIPYLIKFPASYDFKDITNIEYAYYLMACDAGIEMNPSYLFESSKGRYFFGTQRFDIISTGRLHVHSIAGLLYDNFRASILDYSHIMNLSLELQKNRQAFADIFRLCAFNVLSHNKDDHSKNFSFLMNENGEWKFSPCYDLTFSHTNHGYQSSTSVDNKSKNINTNDLIAFAKKFDLENIKFILDQVQNAITNWKYYANEAGVSKQSINIIQKSLNEVR